jgi:glutamate dehydrogenase (NAD(P)+)
MRFGRLEKRFDERAYGRIVEQIEATTGKTISDRDKELIIRGADEVDLVRSGLEETMITGFQGIYSMYKDNAEIKDLRTAAFALAISKISSDYIALGIWP